MPVHSITLVRAQRHCIVYAFLTKDLSPPISEKTDPCGAIHRSAWKGNSPKFVLELARIGSQLLAFDSATSDQTAAPPLFDTFATRLSAQPLSPTAPLRAIWLSGYGVGDL